MNISPHADWDGTAGSGYVGSGENVPTDPTRTTYKPAARWMVTPVEERFSGTHKIQLSAFAKGGITGVTFYCEGSSTTVTDLTLFADGNYGYEVTIDTSAEGTDGELEIYAEIEPTAATAQNRVLGPINRWSNTNATLNNTGTVFYINTNGGASSAAGSYADPYDSFDSLKTGEAAGLPTANDWSGIEIRLMSATGNDFVLSGWNTNFGAVTVTYASEDHSSRGVTLDTVNGSNNVVSVSNTIFRGLVINQGVPLYNNGAQFRLFLWDDCLLQGDDVENSGIAVNLSSDAQTSFINCDADTWISLAPYAKSLLVRNCTLNNGTGDILTGSRAAFGVTITAHTQEAGEHVDLLQIESTLATAENSIFQGVKSLSQGGQGIFITSTILGEAVRDIAFVNCILDSDQTDLNWPLDHMILYYCTVATVPFRFNSGTAMEDLPVTGITGSFTALSTITGGTSGATASINKNASVSSGSSLWVISRSGTFTASETVTEDGGDGSATIDGSASYVNETGYSEMYGNYFTQLTSGVEAFMESDWTIDRNVFADALEWNPGSSYTILADPFIDSANDNFTPNGMTTAPRINQVPWDADGNARLTNTAIGSLEETIRPSLIHSASSALLI